jgi:hypothetical protein
MRNAYKASLVNLKGSDYLGDLGVNEKILLKWILKKHACEDMD